VFHQSSWRRIVEIWEEDEAYKRSRGIVHAMKVVNDIAEWRVALMEEYNKLHTTNEEQKQYLLLLVKQYRRNTLTLRNLLCCPKHFLNYKKYYESFKKLLFLLNIVSKPFSMLQLLLKIKCIYRKNLCFLLNIKFQRLVSSEPKTYPKITKKKTFLLSHE
jgi:hypothetical protein